MLCQFVVPRHAQRLTNSVVTTKIATGQHGNARSSKIIGLGRGDVRQGPPVALRGTEFVRQEDAEPLSEKKP